MPDRANDARVRRMVRELRCDPATQWFESLFGKVEPGVPAPAAKGPEPAPAPVPEENSHIESWLM